MSSPPSPPFAETRPRVVTFLGSPRRGGNTDTLAGTLLEGAAAAGLWGESYALRRLGVGPCTGCGRCWSTAGPCVLDDGMTELYDVIAGADVLVFVTPVYWYGPTAIMKAFIDRLVPFNRERGRPLVRGKAAALVSAWEERGIEAAEPLIRMFELSFRYLELRFVERLLVDEAASRDAVARRPDVLARAREVGAALARHCDRTGLDKPGVRT